MAQHRKPCRKACAGCDAGCWCHGVKPIGGGRTHSPANAPLGLKAAMGRLRRALDAAKAYMARLKGEIEVTAEELEGMIGGNPPED